MAAKLEILSGTDTGRKFQLDAGRWLVGRGEDCDIRIPCDSMSRHHVLLSFENHAWQVTDLGSQNGTFIDGKQVGKSILAQPTRMLLGSVEVQFFPVAGAEPAVPAAPVAAKPAVPTSGTITVTAPLPVVPAPAAAPTPAPVPLPTPAPAPATTTGAAKAGKTGQAPEVAVPPATLEAILKNIKEMGAVSPRLEKEFGRVIVGQREVLEQLLIAIAANGHCLMVGLPGLAKTLMVSTLSKLLQLSFKRIQFTPDLMPSDILGSEVLEVNEATGQKSFRFVKGPIFTNMLLADEINRTPPKTQAALLEAMQERQVTVANNLFHLPKPFFVLATQNPLEQEGTYPLPEAQLDRFMFNIMVEYPDEADEVSIVHSTTGKSDTQLQQVITANDLLRLQETVRGLPVSGPVVEFATRLVRSTRPKDKRAPDFIKEYVFCGAGPRAAQFLILGAKAKAVLHGRANVSCDDIRSLALPVLRHRLFTNFSADSEGITPDDLVKRLLDPKIVPEPSPQDYPAR